MNDKKRQRQYYLSYTCLFTAISAVMILVFWLNNRSFIWSKDGAAQHYPSLVYIHRFLVSIVKNALHGDFHIPMVDFQIGEGMDILTTLNYYGFGDPLTLTAVLCPQGHLETLYGILIFVRLYLSGIFFSMFCFSKKQEQRVTVLIGTLVFVFCGYALYAAVRHPFFVNGMMYLPLYLLGIERIVQKKKYGMFSVVVYLSLISNFYFGYMNTVMMALYVLFLLIPDKIMLWKDKGILLLKMIGSYLCGVAISGAIMVPMVMAYLTCSRGGEGGYTDSMLFYPKNFYQNFVLAYAMPSTSIGEWTNLGFAGICLVAVVLLFVRRDHASEERLRNGKLRVAYILLTVMMLVPMAGKVMNGFGYVSNRWNYAYAMLNAYILICMLPVILRWIQRILERRMPHFEGKRFQISIVICLLMTVRLMANIVITYSNQINYYLGEFDVTGTVEQSAENTPVEAIKKLDATKTEDVNESEKAFSRVEQPWTIGNQSLLMGYQGHNWYFSIAPSWYFDFYNGFQLNAMERTYSLRGLDSRTALNELTATRYYTTSRKDDGLIPYGYKKIQKVKGQDGVDDYIYENTHFLQLGYTTSAWVKESEYQLLSPIEKQETIMQSVVLPDEVETSMSTRARQPASLNLDSKQEFCKVASCSGLTWKNNKLSVNQPNATIELLFDGMANAETYLWFNEFQVEKCGTQYQIGTVESDDTVNYFVLMNPKKSAWYDEPDQTINLGYSKEPRTRVKITFPEKGVYSLDDFMVVYQPMNSYNTQVHMLKGDTLDHLKVSTNRISGDITLSKTKILQMAVPYSKGWTAYVDGQKTEILRSNQMYMALELESGEHEIVFQYATPYLKAGMIISLCGVILCLVVVRTSQSRTRKKRCNQEKGTINNAK